MRCGPLKGGMGVAKGRFHEVEEIKGEKGSYDSFFSFGGIAFGVFIRPSTLESVGIAVAPCNVSSPGMRQTCNVRLLQRRVDYLTSGAAAAAISLLILAAWVGSVSSWVLRPSKILLHHDGGSNGLCPPCSDG